MEKIGLVKRSELTLRIYYPEVETTIFRLASYQYAIHCKGYTGDFIKLIKEFGFNMCIVGVNIQLVNQRPSQFLEIISKISDSDISKNFEGLGMNKTELLAFLKSKFPKIDFLSVEDEDDLVKIFTAEYSQTIGDTTYHRFLSNSQRKELNNFIEGLNWLGRYEIIEKKVVKKPDNKLIVPPLSSPVRSFSPANTVHQYVRRMCERDEALWFDNVDKIYQGSFSKEDFFFYEKDKYSCYVSFAPFGNINLRNHLLLFQKVFVTPPYEMKFSDWLKDQKILKTEFIELVSTGRIVLVLVQPEFRYDLKMINECYEANSNSVISKRAIAALHQVNIVDISSNYILHGTENMAELFELCKRLSPIIKVSDRMLFNLLIWPITALRSSFESLHRGGHFDVSNFGVNQIIEPRIVGPRKDEISFEFNIHSPNIHLAHSLNATYFPFNDENGYSDGLVSSILGELLNIYKNATASNISSDQKQSIITDPNVLKLNPMEIIELNDYIPIKEFEDALRENRTYPYGLKLIETLSDLEPEPRNEKIREYNITVQKIVNRKKRKSYSIDLSRSTLMDLVSMGLGVNFLGTIITLLKGGLGKSNFAGKLHDEILTKIEGSTGANQDQINTNFLARINSVAKIKGL